MAKSIDDIDFNDDKVVEEVTDRTVPPAKAVNKLSRDAVRELKLSGQTTPLDFMLSIMNDDDQHISFRFEAAKAAAPYVHSKLATVMNKTPHDELTTQIQQAYFDRLLAMKDGPSGPPPPTTE